MTIAALVARGYTTKQIAARLRLAPATVTTHLSHSRTKLGLSSRAELAAWFTRHHAGLTPER